VILWRHLVVPSPRSPRAGNHGCLDGLPGLVVRAATVTSA
jgi:hypothetical protein